MFREEIGGYEEPPRPPRQATPWVPLVLLVVTGLAVVHVGGLTKPLVQLAGAGSHAPGVCLVGDWESNDDPMFRRISYVAPKDGKSGNGIYRGHADRGTRAVIYHIDSQDRSGRNLELAEYWPDADYNYRARYAIASDGKSLTREYTDPNGTHVSCQYRYLGPPTETPY